MLLFRFYIVINYSINVEHRIVLIIVIPVVYLSLNAKYIFLRIINNLLNKNKKPNFIP